MRIKVISLFMLAATIIGSCSKNYLNINEVNPNQTQNPPISGLLASVTYQSALNINRAGNITAYYTQQLASPNAASGSDIYDNVDRSNLWYNVYNTIQDGRIMQMQAAAANGFAYVGVAKVMEAMNMSMLFDLFGDVPYSEAFNPTNYTPKYDKAEDIFNACLRLLDEAIAEFDKPTPAITLDASSDLVHGGSVPAWKKTANALKARLLNRLSKKSSYNPAQILAAVSGAYTTNADDAQLTKFTSRSPWNLAAYNNTQLLLDAWMSEYSVNAMNGTTYGVFDPRIKYITDTTRGGIFKGTPNGKGRVGTGTNRDESYLSLNGFYAKGGAPLLLVTFAEMKFIEAEASFATDKTRSYNAYLAGIAAHMDKLGVTTAEKNTYLSNPEVAVGAANFTKDLIFKEKYIAMFLHPEAWTDARRYDYKYKNFTLPANALLPTFIRRVGYPTTETDRNSANVPAVASLTNKLYFEQ